MNSSRAVIIDPSCSLTDVASELLYRVDEHGRLTFLNTTGITVLEALEENWKDKALFDFVHEDDRCRLAEITRRIHETGLPAHDVDLRMLGLCGTLLHTRHQIFPADPAEPQKGLLGAATNTGDLHRLEEQLHQSQKLETIGLLAGGIAHDFNNMLAAILGFTELMIEEREAGDPDLRTLSYIQKSTERAAALVKQLLVYSRKSTAELKPIHLGDVVHETLGIIERTLPKNIRIVAYTDEEADSVLGDAGRLQQALMNLCLNARDAMPRGGELRISVEHMAVMRGATRDGVRAGSYVRLKVQDTGAGISPEVADLIWEPFFTTKEAGQGTGLGLAVVQSIIRAHGGYVQVESQPGSGTSFYLYLPSAPAYASTGPTSLAEPPGGHETILVVDDEEILLNLLVDILGRKGYRVVTANSGREALEILGAAADRIDLMISDNMMPGMMGRELAREVRRVAPNTRVVLCSGYSGGTDADSVEPENVSAYVQKPYQRRELLTRVREVLDARAEQIAKRGA